MNKQSDALKALRPEKALKDLRPEENQELESNEGDLEKIWELMKLKIK